MILRLNMKKAVFVFLVFVLCCGIVFIWGEVFVRINNRLYSNGIMPSANQKLVYELDPTAEETVFKESISSQGLYDKEYTIKKPAGVYRIAVIGDSNGFGWRVGWTKAFPNVLENYLNNARGRHYEVINFSVLGYNMAQELEVLKSKVLAYDPDMVMLVYCGNDYYLTNWFQPEITARNFLFHKSYFIHWIIERLGHRYFEGRPWWRWVKKNILGMYYPDISICSYPGLESRDRSTPHEQSTVPKKYWYMIGKDNYWKFLSEFLGIIDKNKIEFFAVGSYPGLGSEIYHYLKRIRLKDVYCIRDILEKDADSRNITLELERALAHIPIDGHMNELGHQIVAQYLYERLKERFGAHL